MSDIDTQMKANETASGTAEADAQSALSGVTALNSQVGGIQTSVTALETAQPLDEAQIETNRQNIATNAQNIVDLDNRMGHTSISGIGDGSATGAIKAVDDKVGDLADLDTTDKSSIVNAINEAVAGGGGDASTVRYNNGWIEYTDDGGTTWHQLINVSTPQQLLPVMTSSTSSIGTVSATSGASGAPAYEGIDGSTISTGEGVNLPQLNDSVTFTFAVPTYVKSISAKIATPTGLSSVAETSIDYTEDGLSWITAGVQNTSGVGGQFDDMSAPVNKTVVAIRIRHSSQAGTTCFKQLEAWN